MENVRTTIAALMASAKQSMHPHEKMQTPKRQTRYCYVEGPMYYLGQQIVKAMQDAGYPAEIRRSYESPKDPKEVGYWNDCEEPHEICEAVDIVHPSLGWNVSRTYWATLGACVRTVADRYGVELVHGYDFKYPQPEHVELGDWRKVQDRYERTMYREGLGWHEYRKPTEQELAQRFMEVLPDVWKQRGGM